MADFNEYTLKMKIYRHVFIDEKFVIASFQEALDDQSLINFTKVLNVETDGITDLRQLSDCTKIENVSELTVLGIYKCAMREVVRPGSRLAILVSGSGIVYELSILYRSFAREKRKDIRIFTNRASAIGWLAKHETEISRLASLCEMSSG